MTFVYLLLLFFGSHIYLEKKGLPQFIDNSKLRYVLVGSIGVIILSIVLGTVLWIGAFCAMTATVLSSSIIAYKFRSKFEKMERGKSV
ncbi:hypothetical protein [Enterococcus mediterraneensis]|uniref:hypothetical protein n=1 Tax=Enterococcus mediterraneensis TaxID=2364791 RepID=UPI000F05B56A|nr:hypothetical protein [Enterococcus mediterraneensis]